YAPVNVIRELVRSLDAMLLNVPGDPDGHAEAGNRGPAQVEAVLRIGAVLVPVTQKMLVQVAIRVSKIVHQVRCQDAIETNSRFGGARTAAVRGQREVAGHRPHKQPDWQALPDHRGASGLGRRPYAGRGRR